VNRYEFKKITALLEEIAENTKPPGWSRKIFDLIALLVTISGIFGAIQLIAGWLGGK
jgi:hypothetical protein